VKVLLVGNGGREHALLWKLHRDRPSARFFITRGNGGTDAFATPVPLAPEDVAGVASWAAGEAMDLVVVGPEGPLAGGMVDALAERGIPALGPGAAAAEIEASKAFSKDLMHAAGVPTAGYRVFTETEPAEEYIHDQGAPIVVKASGLAAGKGAIVCETEQEAIHAVRRMLRSHDFGTAGLQVVIEERMRGEEISVFALTDGRDVLVMPPSQDHKRIGEGDTGPNTGGMGAYLPVSIVDAGLMSRVEDRILLPTLEEMRRRKRPFRGLLYAGLMLTEDGPKVVEYNCRFGDPETQAVLPLLDSSLLEPIEAIARGGSIRGASLFWKDAAAVTTVLASGGYPGEIEKGLDITIPDGLESEPDVLVFHAGTMRENGRLVTSGGRVAAVTGRGRDIREAAARSRDAAERIHFEGRQYRRDIGWRELERAGAS
jgi:phosphoribosylamine---glycine ligase